METDGHLWYNNDTQFTGGLPAPIKKLLKKIHLWPTNPKDRKFLEEEIDKFFFGDGPSKIDNFVPE